MVILTAQQIARELIHPTQQWHVSHIGDSRAVALQQNLCSHAVEIAWSGCEPITMSGFNATSHEAIIHYVTGGSAPTENANIPGEAVNPWTATSYGSAIFTGSAAPTNAAAALCSGAVNAEMFPLVHERLIRGGGAAKWRALYHQHATGIVGGDGVRLVAVTPDRYSTPLVAPSYASVSITDTTGSGLVVAEIEIPSGFDWSAYAAIDAPAIAWMCEPGGANLAGSLFQWAGFPWIEANGTGIVHHNHSLNGAKWDWWLDDNLNPAAKWSDLAALYGSNAILWSSCGYNSRGDSIEQQASDLTSVIARFRATFADAPVVVDTQYPGSDTGDNPNWVAACITVASAVPGVLLLHTYAVRTYAQANAMGWIDDGCHYNPTGKNAYAEDIGDLVLEAATGGAYAIHSNSIRDTIAATIRDAIDASGAGKLQIREDTTIISTITLSDPCGTITEDSGVLVFSDFPKYCLSCENAGTPNNAIFTDSDDNTIIQVTAGVGTEYELNLSQASYAAGEPMKVLSASYTAPV